MTPDPTAVLEELIEMLASTLCQALLKATDTALANPPEIADPLVLKRLKKTILIGVAKKILEHTISSLTVEAP